MAKKKEVNSEEEVIGEIEGVEAVVVKYEDLMSAKVRVEKDGVEAFYIDPARKLGEFILRPIPQAMEEAGEIPEGWRKPTPEETAKAEDKIDWDIPKAKTHEEDKPEEDKPEA